MERNSSIASEGSVDLCGAGYSATRSRLHAPEPLMQQQECIGACRSSEIWARGVDIPRRCARGDGTIAFRGSGRFALCVVVRGIVGQLEPVECLCGGRDEADGRPSRGTVEDGGGVVLGVRSGRSEPHWAGGYEDDVFVRIIGHCWCTGESRMYEKGSLSALQGESSGWKAKSAGAPLRALQATTAAPILWSSHVPRLRETAPRGPQSVFPFIQSPQSLLADRLRQTLCRTQRSSPYIRAHSNPQPAPLEG